MTTNQRADAGASPVAPPQNQWIATPFLEYKIGGGSTPFVVCRLKSGQSMTSPSGGRLWTKGPIQTKTQANGGVLKSLGRSLSGGSFFMSVYEAQGDGEIAFATVGSGSIFPRILQVGEVLICQKRTFLAATTGVNFKMHFQKKLGAGLFGGEGFVMQRVEGPGLVFLAVDGGAYEYALQDGEDLVCDTGALAWMDATCSLDVRTVSGVKNMFLGGEGLFDTIVTGPGRATLQTFPLPFRSVGSGS